MDYDTFIISIQNDSPPNEFPAPKLAMWHALNDNWDSAHHVAQSINNDLGS